MLRSVHQWLAAALIVSTLCGCAARVVYNDDDLDSGQRPVRVVRLSESLPAPSAAERDRPVVVATHGFSSTPWELEPFVAAMQQRGIRVSAVTLGAHGTSLDDFAKSDWRRWSEPLLAEYRALRAQGYRHVAIMGHSTGATLWLQALAEGRLAPVPERMVFVAPLIEFAPRTRGIYAAGILPWFGIQAIERPLKGASHGKLYRWRPVSTLTTLSEVTTGVRTRLSRGLTLPASSHMLVVQGDRDDVVDPEGARLLVKGLVGAQARLMMVDSWMHNPIGPEGIQGHRFTAPESALRDRLLNSIGTHLSR